MGRLSSKLAFVGLTAGIALAAMAARQGFAQGYGFGPPTAERLQAEPNTMAPAPRPSLADSFKSGLKRMARAVTPKAVVKPSDDPVSLSTKAEPSAELYVAVARVHEQSGNLAEAAKEYERALEHTPDHLGAVLGYARLKDQSGDTEAALALYQQAVEAHGDEPAAHNNLGLFYARHGRLSDSAASLERAIRLERKTAKYRNNAASVLVEMGRHQEAYNHLRAVHGEAVAYYNLGYLLEKKGMARSAAQHYAKAAKVDPSLAPAQVKLAQLQPLLKQAAEAPAPQQEPPRGLSERPARPAEEPKPRGATPPTSPPFALPGWLSKLRTSSAATHAAPAMPQQPFDLKRLPSVRETPGPTVVAPLPPGVQPLPPPTVTVPPADPSLRPAQSPLIRPLPRWK